MRNDVANILEKCIIILYYWISLVWCMSIDLGSPYKKKLQGGIQLANPFIASVLSQIDCFVIYSYQSILAANPMQKYVENSIAFNASTVDVSLVASFHIFLLVYAGAINRSWYILFLYERTPLLLHRTIYIQP